MKNIVNSGEKQLQFCFLNIIWQGINWFSLLKIVKKFYFVCQIIYRLRHPSISFRHLIFLANNKNKKKRKKTVKAFLKCKNLKRTNKKIVVQTFSKCSHNVGITKMHTIFCIEKEKLTLHVFIMMWCACHSKSLNQIICNEICSISTCVKVLLHSISLV